MATNQNRADISLSSLPRDSRVLTEQEIMRCSEIAGFGGVQRRTLKIKLLRFAKLVMEANNEPTGVPVPGETVPYPFSSVW